MIVTNLWSFPVGYAKKWPVIYEIIIETSEYLENEDEISEQLTAIGLGWA